MKYVILMLISFNVYAHGSSHPRWKVHESYNGYTYVSCSSFDVSTVPAVEIIHVVHDRVLLEERWYWNSYKYVPRTEVFIKHMDEVVSIEQLSSLVRSEGRECSHYESTHRYVSVN